MFSHLQTSTKSSFLLQYNVCRPKLGRKDRGGAATGEIVEPEYVYMPTWFRVHADHYPYIIARPPPPPPIHTVSRNPDLLEPYLLRSLLNVKTVSVHASCAGCHFVAIDIDGNAWLFGRNGFGCLGVPDVEYISENAPRLVKATDLGAPKGSKFIHAACGRNHTILVGSDGTVWAAGQNHLGQVCTVLFVPKPYFV